MTALKNRKIALLLHIYYPDTYSEILNELQKINDLSFHLLINICEETPNKNEIVNAFKDKIPHSKFISTANIGKDIGGKLALTELLLYLKLDPEWVLFIHDKKSPQSVNGMEWRDTLYRVMKKKSLPLISEMMDKKNVGIIGSKEFVVSYSRKTREMKSDPNFHILTEQAHKLSLKLCDFSFIGGTIFWIRKSILEDFLKENNALELRAELESGNVIDNFTPKITHTWERLFGLIAVNQGYKVVGI